MQLSSLGLICYPTVSTFTISLLTPLIRSTSARSFFAFFCIFFKTQNKQIHSESKSDSSVGRLYNCQVQTHSSQKCLYPLTGFCLQMNMF